MKKDFTAKQLLVRAKTQLKKQVKKQEKRQNKRLVKRQARQLVGVTGNPAPKTPETPAPEASKQS